MFRIDNLFFRIVDKVVDAVMLNIFWLICCIPVITIGTSTTAFYYTFHKTIREGRGYVMREFFSCFRREFRQTFPVWILFMVLYGIFGFDLYITYGMAKEGMQGGRLSIVFLVLLAIVFVWGQYVFPYMARFEDTSRNVLKLTAFIAVANLPRTGFIPTAAVACSYILWRFPPGIFFIPVMYMTILNELLEKIFKKYMPPEEQAE